MIQLTSIGVTVEKGVIPRIFKLPFTLFEATIAVDMGIIPPKNYFQTSLSTIGMTIETGVANLNVQIL